jgi:streptogramin lyase
LQDVPEASVASLGPYGGAVDGGNDLWFITKGTNSDLVKVEFDDLTYEIWPNPPAMWSYGFTVDSSGRPWIGGFTNGMARFDLQTETWDLLPEVQGFGIQEDANGLMWTATTPGFGAGVHSIDADTMAVLDHVPLPGNFTKGVSIDFDGYVWVVDQGPNAFKVDPDTLTWEVYDGLDQAYTYSDMTGWGLKNVVPEG